QKELTAGQREFLQKALGYYCEFARESAAEQEGRRLEGNANFRVAYLLKNLGEPTEAEKAYRTALVIFEKLAADFPAVSEYREELAISHNGLAILLRDLGK